METLQVGGGQSMGRPEILYSVRAQRGPKLRCKGWKQETILRMLENNMENAEKPEELVIYGGIGKCARNWESYHATVDALLNLEDDETLVMQSGMPVAVFQTHKLAPRVVMANTNIMKADWPTFYDLQDKNLTMFAQYTAGPWEYIGTQGVIQGTFETLSAIARKHYDDSLVGRILLTAGAGGEEDAAHQGVVIVLAGDGGERLEGALDHALRADVLPRSGGVLGEHGEVLVLEIVEGGPVGLHDVGVGHDDPGRQLVGLEHGHRHARLHHEGLVVLQVQERIDGGVVRLPVAGTLADATVDHQLLR